MQCHNLNTCYIGLNMQVVAERHSFYEKATSHGCLAVVYDIPLLLEQRHQHDVDYVVVVTASSDTQRTRVLSRPNMTLEKFESILVKQMPDAEKRQLADFVINTDYPGVNISCVRGDV